MHAIWAGGERRLLPPGVLRRFSVATENDPSVHGGADRHRARRPVRVNRAGSSPGAATRRVVARPDRSTSPPGPASRGTPRGISRHGTPALCRPVARDRTSFPTSPDPPAPSGAPARSGQIAASAFAHRGGSAAPQSPGDGAHVRAARVRRAPARGPGRGCPYAGEWRRLVSSLIDSRERTPNGHNHTKHTRVWRGARGAATTYNAMICLSWTQPHVHTVHEPPLGAS